MPFKADSGTAVRPDGSTVVWSLTPSGMINIGTTSLRIKAKLLKGDTEADAQRRVEAKLAKLAHGDNYAGSGVLHPARGACHRAHHLPLTW